LFILCGTPGESVPGPCRSFHMLRAVHWAARRSLREEGNFSSDAKKLEARRTGVRGETYSYWYLRRRGYVFVARNYTPRGIKGEVDLIGYDGQTLTFVEVRTRTIRDDLPALPELSVTRENNMCWCAPRSVFWRNVTSVRVPAGLMLWQLTTALDSRRWFVCTRMRSVPKFEIRRGELIQGDIRRGTIWGFLVAHLRG
jgi:Holliday junction resolvase-like predicted endonuclease